jgi:WD40 repeat protein
VVSGGDDGQVRIWDLESGAQVGSPLAADPYCVASVAVAELAGRPVIVSGGETGVIRRWDLADGRLVGSDIRAHYAVVRTLAVRDLAIGVSDGDPVIVSAGFEDGAVRVWGLESGELIREHRFGLDDQDRPRKIYSVLTTVIKNRPVIVASGEGGIRTWYLDDGSPYRELATNSRFDIISTVAATIVDGHEMILYGDHHGHINHWDPIGGEIDVLGENSNAFSTALAIADLSGVAVVVTAWYFGSDSGRLIRVWDIRTKALMGTLSGHESEVLALAVDRIGGRSTILSGGTDRTVRVWDLASDLREEEPVSPEPLDAGLAVGRVGGRDVVAYGDREGGMRLWQLADGTPVRRPSKFHRKFLALWLGWPPSHCSFSR